MADEKTNEMKTLANLRPAAGSHRNRKRLGRGIGSGLGKTSGRGHKGSGQRKSPNMRPGFEGGNMPLYMRLPKRGFHSLFRKEFNVVNVDAVEKRFEAGAKVDPESLLKAGLLRDKKLPVKLLGRGTLEKNLEFHVHKASKGAQEAVSKAGGSVSIIEQRKPAPIKNSKKKQKKQAQA